MKIPFAIREGEIICISDLSLREKGLKCASYCVACEAPLIARMGEIKIHHFAHSTRLCDEGKAYSAAMYMLVKELIEKRKVIRLPGVKMQYNYVGYSVSEYNMKSIIKKIPVDYEEQEEYLYKLVTKDKVVEIEDSTFSFRHNEQIDALIVQIRDKKLALKIGLPSSICKDYYTVKYKDMPTLEIDFSEENYELHKLKKQDIEEIIIDKIENKKWITNPKIDEAYREIIRENEKYILEHNKNKAKQSKLKEIKSNNYSRVTSQQNELRNISDKDKRTLGYQEIEKKFDRSSNEIMCDRFGQRWVYCTNCYKIKRVEEMVMHGGRGTLNDGFCSECNDREK